MLRCKYTEVKVMAKKDETVLKSKEKNLPIFQIVNMKYAYLHQEETNIFCVRTHFSFSLKICSSCPNGRKDRE